MRNRSFFAIAATLLAAQLTVAQTAAVKATEEPSPGVITGLFKAVALDNKTVTPGIDDKFKFNPDKTFTFTRKTMTATLVTHGTYVEEGGKIIIRPASRNAQWPEFWQKEETLILNQNGELEMNGLSYKPSLIGKIFTPGRYTCEKTPAIHYFFDRNGGYKYTGQGMSTGEYWVENLPDPTGTDQVTLILNILRVDGKRVNFHQRIPVDTDGGFVLEKKYKYHLIGTTPIVAGESVSRPTVTSKPIKH